MAGYRPGVPDDWFVDPAERGVPGTRRPDREDDSPLAWMADALCAQTDPEMFFPEKGGSTRDAKRICAQCPVRQQCLEYALANDERYGIWGGLSERERRKLKRDRERAAQAELEGDRERALEAETIDVDRTGERRAS